MCPTTIMLADDHPVVRMGLRSLLEREKDLSVIGETFDGLETVRMVKSLCPDVLVLDLMMPGMNGIYVTEELKQTAPKTRIIILSMHASEMYVQEAFKRGADGYVLKDTVAEEIVRAIRTVMGGRRYTGELTEEGEVEAYKLRSPDQGAEPYEALTMREREILHLVASGHQNNEVAQLLSISVRTVETHRAKIMRKLNLRNAADLIHYAVQKKIV